MGGGMWLSVKVEWRRVTSLSRATIAESLLLPTPHDCSSRLDDDRNTPPGCFCKGQGGAEEGGIRDGRMDGAFIGCMQ